MKLEPRSHVFSSVFVFIRLAIYICLVPLLLLELHIPTLSATFHSRWVCNLTVNGIMFWRYFGPTNWIEL